MGTYAVGILGNFSGAIGTVVGSNWKKINYMRMRGARKRTGTPSQAQVEQQAKFKLVTHFLRSVRSLTAITFKSFSGYMSANNYALSSNLNKVIKGLYPSFEIDYSAVLLSYGLLAIASLATAKALVTGKINFTWIDESDTDMDSNATDIAVLVAYCKETNVSKYLLNAGSRSELASSIDVAGFSGKPVETWILFISADGKSVSGSVYTGMVTVL